MVKRIIEVDCETGPQYVVGSVKGGLAIHRVVGPKHWQVTHVGSGLALGPAQEFRELAKEMARRLLGLGIDWEHETVAQILEHEAELRSIFAAFEGGEHGARGTKDGGAGDGETGATPATAIVAVEAEEGAAGAERGFAGGARVCGA